MTKHLRLLGTMILAFCLSAVSAQVSITNGTLTLPATSLGQAFAAINAGTIKGNITITINGNTTEAATASLDSSGNPTGSLYTAVKIKPGNGVAANVNGALALPLVKLNGADRVTIDGLNSGGSSLTFYNTSTASTASTLQLINDATNNVFVHATFKGACVGSATAASASGVIHFSTGIAVGNSRNNLFECNIDGTGAASNCLYSYGTTTSFASQNNQDSLYNCNVYDFFNSTVAPVGINLYNGNTYWFFWANSIYQTVPRTTALQAVQTPFRIFPSYTADAHELYFNYIGGSGPQCSGTMSYTASGTNLIGFQGLSLQAGGGSYAYGNVVKNVNITISPSAASSYGNAGILAAISGYDGEIYLDSNEVSNIVYNNTTNQYTSFAGVYLSGSLGGPVAAGQKLQPYFEVTSNIVKDITLNNGSVAASSHAQLYGIRLESAYPTATYTVKDTLNNYFVILADTINYLAANGAGSSAFVRGVSITNGTSNAAAQFPKPFYIGNVISNLSTTSTLASYTSAAATGIENSGFASTLSANYDDVVTLLGNTIFNLSSSSATDLSNSVIGIRGTNGIYDVNRNKIYGLTSAALGAPSGTPLIAGINLRSMFDYSPIYNNYVALGSGVNNNAAIYGILNNFSSGAPIGVYHNTVLISGNPSASTKYTSALHRGNELNTTAITTLIDAENNFLINQRTGGGSSNNFAMSIAGNISNFFTNYNALVSSASNKIVCSTAVANSFATWKNSSLQDKYSVSAVTGGASDFTVSPSILSVADIFSDPAPATTGTLNINSDNSASWLVNNRAYTIPDINKDFGGDTRGIVVGFPTDMGADEFTTATTPPQLIESGSFSNGGTTDYSTFERKVASITWNSIGNISSRTGYYYPGYNPPGATAGKYTNGYWDMNVNGGASGYDYNITLALDSSMLGTAPNNASLRLTKRTGGSWLVAPGSVPDNVNMLVTQTNYTSFSQFAGTDATDPLPVDLLSFSGRILGRDAKLYWSTATESNNAGFDIERKAEGGNWVKAGYIMGAGNAASVKQYSFTDPGLAPGVYQYRLRQVNFSGIGTYSKEISLKVSGKPVFVVSNIFPNPIVSAATFEYQLPSDYRVTVELFNMGGQKMATIINKDQAAGSYTQAINADQLRLANGSYMFKVTAVDKATNSVTRKEIKLVVNK